MSALIFAGKGAAVSTVIFAVVFCLGGWHAYATEAWDKRLYFWASVAATLLCGAYAGFIVWLVQQ